MTKAELQSQGYSFITKGDKYSSAEMVIAAGNTEVIPMGAVREGTGWEIINDNSVGGDDLHVRLNHVNNNPIIIKAGETKDDDFTFTSMVAKNVSSNSITLRYFIRGVS